MSEYIPSFTIEIAGVEYTNDILNGGTITFGRFDMFSSTSPSYCVIDLVNLSGASPDVKLNDTIVIKVTDSSATDIELFTGEVSSVINNLEGASDGYAVNTLNIQAVGALGKLVRRTAGSDAYPQEFDGERIERILEDALYTQWEDVPSTLTWANVDAAQTWEDFAPFWGLQYALSLYKVLIVL